MTKEKPYFESVTTDETDIKEIPAEPKKCGCGTTKDPNGNCDGSHNQIKK